MTNYKIIFTGPVGAGKTTAISSICDRPPVSTDKIASDMTRDVKKTTTVACDYGTVHLSGNDRLHLYGTPGQERFDFMWDILTSGGIGLILLLDNTRPNPFQDMNFFLDQFQDFIKQTQVAIGVTQMDRKPVPCIDDYHNHLSKQGLSIPIFDVDARKRYDVSLLIKALLFSLDPGLIENND